MSARLLRDPYDSPMVRYRWVYMAFVVFWWLMVALGIGNVIRHIRDHVPFEFNFWAGLWPLMVIAFLLVRARRFRRAAAARAQARG